MSDYKVLIDMKVSFELPVYADSPEEAMDEIKNKNIWAEIFPGHFLPVLDGSYKITGALKQHVNWDEV